MNTWEEGPRRFARDGYAIYQQVFDDEGLARLRVEADRLRLSGERLTETTWEGLVRWLVQAGTNARPVLRGLQYPYRVSAVFDEVRTDPAIQRILAPLIGANIVTVIATLFWKPAGARQTVIAYHQDSAFRRPAEKFRNLATSCVQVGIALDPHGPGNGGMRFVSGSHQRGDLGIQQKTSVMVEAPTDHELARLGFLPEQVRDIEIDAGDAVIWHAHVLHGSPPNRSGRDDRLFYVIGYMMQSDSDEGDPAFIGGKPCPYVRGCLIR
jgi:ectoine hydroxylase-related dioxygenase (phytanoyl-CoA dioxygenase family)